MAESFPSNPGLARQEDGDPQENKSPPESTVPPLRTAASKLPLYKLERKNMDCIEAFANSQVKNLRQKFGFLESICCVFKTARLYDMQNGLDVFCHECRLIDNIKMLLVQEPMDQLTTAVRQLAMDAIGEMSSVEKVLMGQEKSLLETCFRSVFCLPSNPKLRCPDPVLYTWTLSAMDNMLVNIVRGFHSSRVSEGLQSILKVLLDFTYSERQAVRERAMGRILILTSHLSENVTLEDWFDYGKDMYGPICCGDFPIPIFGQLLGRVMILRSSEEVTGFQALDTLICLYEFVQRQKSRLRTEDEEVKLDCKPDGNSLLHAPTTKDFLLLFANYLHPPEKTDVVRMAIKALGSSNTCDNQGARNILDAVVKDPRFWLADVPKIMRYIYENLECIKVESARQSVMSLLLVLSTCYPTLVVVNLLKLSSPGDSAGAAMWDLMLSMPEAVEEIFAELLTKPQNAEDFSILGLAPTASREFQAKDDVSQAERYLSHLSLATVSLLLSNFITLSETPDLARKMKVLLPRIMVLIKYGDEEIKLKVLLVFRSVLSHLLRKETSAIAVELARDLLPLFDEESSQLREFSICLFRSLLESVAENDKTKMRSSTWSFLVPLFFHMSDQTGSVAKASGEALLAAAKLLEWKELEHLLKTWQPWRIGECLVPLTSLRPSAPPELLCPWLALNLSPTGLLPGRQEWPRGARGKGGAGRRDRSS
ncbi:uncharacterized protein LOC115618744 isoform X2 [Strigops habroptila]|uniref:uncharacterized protein LOC115618744 isoform X2 n=1 Tax=Strigops habroptila TaxID=2489341 RepID=UPI0011CFB511|nr:uncharacterized protein LOC115618744 isoform X2 [Strigops habroptila]